MRQKLIRLIGIGLAVMLGSALLTGAPAALAQTGIDLCVSAGTLTMADSTTVPIWGFSEFTGTGCAPAQLPGPTLRVAQGSQVTVTLHNELVSRNASILFPGQTLTAVTGTPGLFTSEAPAGGVASYTFIAGAAGTYMYESGTDVDRQLAMGMVGALIVDPATPGQAYSSATTAYDAESVLVLNEIDPNLNANPDGFNMLNYHPLYWLINGQSYPDTPSIQAAAGSRLLVRYLNGGAVHHTMSVLGLRQKLIAKNGYELADGVQTAAVVAETIPSGETADAIITMPGDAAGQQYPLVNRQWHLTNGALPVGTMQHPVGGMLTFIQGQTGPPVQNFINFNQYPLASYGGNQDFNPTVSIEDGGFTLRLTGNGWKKIAFPTNVVHTVTGSTVLEFDFMSTAQGEVHGIGFDSDDNIANPIRVFQLYGTQNWGINAFQDYAASAPGWKHYKIPVGQFYTGAMTHLVFTNDHDVANPTGESVFRNIQVYDEAPPALLVNGTPYMVTPYAAGNQDVNGAALIENGGATLRLTGNTWKKVDLGSYNVTAATTLTVDFSSSVQGEIHGIGFDTDENISANQTFQLYGTQNWGIQAHHNYAGGVTQYTIPVGAFFTGNMRYLVFVMDHDVANPTGESVFGNITIAN